MIGSWAELVERHPLVDCPKYQEFILSNAKRVEITGELPFNATDHHDVRKFFGQMSGPTIGINVKYTGQAKARPNEFGGQTAYYKFCISGVEAVSEAWLENLMQALRNCGASIEKAHYWDIDNSKYLVPLNIPHVSEHKEYVCEVRFTVQDVQKPFQTHDLQEWLKNSIYIDLRTEDAGMFKQDDDGESACVSAGVELKTLSPA